MEETNLNEVTGSLKLTARGIGWRYFIFSVSVTVLQLVYAGIINFMTEKYPDAAFLKGDFTTYLQIILPTYCIGFPLLFLLLKKLPKTEIEKKKMGFGKILLAILIGAGICGIGTIIGLLAETIVMAPFGINILENNGVADLMLNSGPFWRILTVGILAPIVEEFIFRKLLIDRVIKHGEFVAVMMSGIIFGLFHGNFRQFFFATGLGMFFALIYARTGKVWYTILLHMVINLSSSVITVELSMKVLSNMEVVEKIEELVSTDMNAYMEYIMQPEISGVILWIAAYGLWMMVLMFCSFIGAILLLVFRKKLRLNPAPADTKKSTLFSASFFNWGMLLFVLSCIALFVIYYGSMIAAR